MSAGNTTYWVKPEVLRALREASGFQYEKVEQQARKLERAHYAPIMRQDLENWEQSLASPDLEHLETLSEIYGCPVGYFFLPEPPPSPSR